MASLTHAALLTATLLALPALAPAQDRVAKSAPRPLVGVVADTAGHPVAEAEVIIADLARKILTGADGSFRVDSLLQGPHLLRVRKIGYAPQMRQVDVDSTGGVVFFSLTPVVTTLQPIVSSATRRGLSGYVSDLAMHSVEGATVQVLGAGLSTTTAADGSFFLPASPGSYMVSIKKDSFATRLVSVTIPKDSGRHVNAWLQPFSGRLSKAQFWNIDELRERAAWIPPRDRTFFTHEDLVRRKYEWVYDAVISTSAKFNAVATMSRYCPALVSGGPGAVPVGMLTVEDVEAVEILKEFPVAPAPTLATQSKSKYSKVPSPIFLNPNALGAMRTMKSKGQPGASTEAGECLAVYVWLR